MADIYRQRWEEKHSDIRKKLLTIIAKLCVEFKHCLVNNHGKIITESKGDKNWGTGMSKSARESTKPVFC